MQPTPAGYPADLRAVRPTATVHADDGTLAESIMSEIWSSDWDGSGDLSSWTVAGGTPAVSGGRLTFTGGASGSIRRSAGSDFVLSTDVPDDVSNGNYLISARATITLLLSETTWSLLVVNGITTLDLITAAARPGACRITFGVRGRRVWACQDDRLIFSHTLTAAHAALVVGENASIGGANGITGFGPVTVRDVSTTPDSWSVSREIATDVPDQTRAAGGLSRAGGTVDVSPDERVTTDAPFSPWRPGARRRTNQGLQISAGYNGAEVPLLSGVTIDAPGSTRDAALRMTTSDLAERLQHTVELPAIAAVVDGAYSPGLSPTWVVDWLFRSGGFHQCPPAAPVEGSMFFASLMGSAEPDVYNPFFFAGGSYLSAYSDVVGDPAAYVPASWAPLGAAHLYGDYGTNQVTSAKLALTFWVDWSASENSSSGTVEVWGEATDVLKIGSVPLDEATQTVLGVAVATGRVTVYMDTLRSAGIRGIVYQNGVLLGTGDLGPTFSNQFGGFPEWKRLIVNTDGVVLGGVQLVKVESDVSAQRLSYDREATAEIAPSLGNLDGTPGISGTAWEILRQIADAEQGAAWIDETGLAVFRNRVQLRAYTGGPIQVTSESSLLDLEWAESASQLASTVRVPYATVEVTLDRTVWEPDTVRSVLAGTTKTFDAVLTSPVLFGGLQEVFARANADGTGGDMSGDVAVVDFHFRSATKARFRIRNSGNVTAYLVDASGDNSLRIVGAAVVQSDDGAYESTNDSPAPQTLEVSGNPFRQGESAARDLADWLAPQVAFPQPVLTRVPIVPDPRLQLGDLVEIRDPHVTHISQRALVVGIEQAGSADSYTQTLTVRPLSPILADVDSAWSGSTLGALDTFWSGSTLGDFDESPLEVP